MEVKRVKIANIRINKFKDIEYIIVIVDRSRTIAKNKKEKYSLAFYGYGKHYTIIKENFSIGNTVNISFRIKSKIFIDRVTTSLILEKITIWEKSPNSTAEREYFKNVNKYRQ